ncbi:MAG: InlB B-repeat-containing protein [Corallococcus sp.]|nr:InlB B-repeat-containing protein [Corallococcus sp.]
MLYRILLSDTGYYVGMAIEAFFAIAAVVLLILLLKYGIPEMKAREPRPAKEKKPKAEAPTYALTYVGGEAVGNSPEIEYYAKGSKVTLKLNMFSTPTGKQFYGWSDGSKRYLPSTKYKMPGQNVTLTAQWRETVKEEPKKEEEKKYVLTYVSGGAKGHSPASESYTKGTKVTLKSNMFETPKDKEFEGWSDGMKKYLAGNEMVMPEQNVTLTAQWKETVKEEQKPIEIAVPVDEQSGEQQQVEGGVTADGRPIIVNVYNTHSKTEKTVEKEVIHEESDSDEGLEFADYTILQLYDLLTDEQKRYFDTLKEAALAKPQAKLSVGKSYFNIKIGKRSILKLRIRRLITVGEYALENDILKDFRKSSENKAGNSKIKVRPTLVAVTDESTLETALNMIDLVHKQILES